MAIRKGLAPVAKSSRSDQCFQRRVRTSYGCSFSAAARSSRPRSWSRSKNCERDAAGRCSWLRADDRIGREGERRPQSVGGRELRIVAADPDDDLPVAVRLCHGNSHRTVFLENRANRDQRAFRRRSIATGKRHLARRSGRFVSRTRLDDRQRVLRRIRLSSLRRAAVGPRGHERDVEGRQAMGRC